MFTPTMKFFTNQGELFLNRLATYVTNGSFDTAKRDNLPAKADQTRQQQRRVDLKVMSVQGSQPVAILKLRETLDAKCYSDLMEMIKVVHEIGIRHAVLDMSDIPSIGLSSMLTLHSIAVLLHGEEPLDPDDGWEALRAAARDLETRHLQDRFKLFNPQLRVRQTLEQAGFTGFLAIQTDLETAVTSF
jgi:anti-anti-sigma regulatory factor